MKINQSIVGSVIADGDLRYLITSAYPSGRKFYYQQILPDGSLHAGVQRAWATQINHRGGIPRSFRSRQCFSLTSERIA